MQTIEDVLAAAQKFAIDRGQPCIGTEDLLIAVSSSPAQPAARALAMCGATEQSLKSELAKITETPMPFEQIARLVHDYPELKQLFEGAWESLHPEQPGHDCPVVPRVSKAIERAMDEASARGHKIAGPEHLLIALISDNETVATNLLLCLGVDLKTLTTAVTKEANWSL